jgi:ribosomal protein S12 methylthiotransferase accessory factor
MESCESYHAETINLPIIWASVSESSGHFVDVDLLPRVEGARISSNTRIMWVEGYELKSLQNIYVPLEAVHTDYTYRNQASPGHFLCSSNGLGASFGAEPATLHALLEVIERDAYTLFSLSDLWSVPERRLNLTDIPSSTLRDLLCRVRSAGLEVYAWDVTSDLGVPVFFVTLRDKTEAENSILRLVSGCACRLSEKGALSAALLEAIQSRATVISGSRDDLTYPDYHLIDAETTRVKEKRLFGHQSRILADCVPTREPHLEFLLRVLAGHGYNPVAVNLSRRKIGVSVFRVIVPGLEGAIHHPRYSPGRRAQNYKVT